MATVRAENPNAVYFVPKSGASGAMLLEALETSWMNVGVYGTVQTIAVAMTEENVGLYEEVIVTAPQLSDSVGAIRFLSSYFDTYGVNTTIPVIAAGAFDSVYLVEDALTDSGDVAEYLRTQVNAWNGALGTFSFDDNGNSDLESSLLQVIGGDLIRLNAPVAEVEEMVEETVEGEEVVEEVDEEEVKDDDSGDETEDAEEVEEAEDDTEE